jgi:hypothetical protein
MGAFKVAPTEANSWILRHMDPVQTTRFTFLLLPFRRRLTPTTRTRGGVASSMNGHGMVGFVHGSMDNSNGKQNIIVKAG